MKLSIVTTLYKSSLYVDEFYRRASAEAKKITDDYEIIFVDDGSPDDSLQKAIRLHLQDPKVVVVELSRNFGHHKAIMTGLSYATGDYIFLIDSDLEEEPELLSRFWVELQNSDDMDVVYGVQETRKGGWLERCSGDIFWKLINYLSDIKITKNLTTVRLMTKKYNDSLLKYHESELSIGGIWFHNGFKQYPVYIKKGSHSKTTYTLRKKLSLLIISITSFSSKPLIYIFNFGLFITFMSSVFILKIIWDKLNYGISLTGWTSVIVSIWFFGGLIILFLGIIGLYISKIFIETKNRPYTIVRNSYKITSQK